MNCLEKEVLNLILTDKEVRDQYEQQFFGFHLYYGLKIAHSISELWEEFEEIYFSQKTKDTKKAVLGALERVNEKAVYQQFG